MAVNETAEVIKAENRRQARFIYQSALFAGAAANNPAAFPRSLYEAFPCLFTKEVTEQDWRKSKEFMKRFQKNHNTETKIKEEQENDG